MAEPVVPRGGVVGQAIGVGDGLISFVGADDEADRWFGTGRGAPEVVHLDRALVAPAFGDRHLHTVRTASALTVLDRTGATSLPSALDALATTAAARPEARGSSGRGWDETGSPDGLHAARPGERWRASNPCARPGRKGGIAFGSDPPVSSRRPRAAVRTAVRHHQPRHALSPAASLRASTAGGWAAGRLGADLPPELHPDLGLPTLVRLLHAGRSIHEGDT